MSQTDRDKALTAEKRSEETRSFVRTVKAATRSKYTVGRQRKWDNRGGRKTREVWGGVSSLDEVEYFR